MNTIQFHSIQQEPEVNFSVCKDKPKEHVHTQLYFKHVHVTANLWNQILPGIPNQPREYGESLKRIYIEIPRNL